MIFCRKIKKIIDNLRLSIYYVICCVCICESPANQSDPNESRAFMVPAARLPQSFGTAKNPLRRAA